MLLQSKIHWSSGSRAYLQLLTHEELCFQQDNPLSRCLPSLEVAAQLPSCDSSCMPSAKVSNQAYFARLRWRQAFWLVFREYLRGRSTQQSEVGSSPLCWQNLRQETCEVDQAIRAIWRTPNLPSCKPLSASGSARRPTYLYATPSTDANPLSLLQKPACSSHPFGRANSPQSLIGSFHFLFSKIAPTHQGSVSDRDPRPWP